MALSLGYDNLDGPDLDVVYIPSQSIDPQEIAKLFGFVYYEERPLLCSLLRLREYKSSRCVFITSTPISQQVVAYYLGICDQSIEVQEDIKNRLLLLSVDDASPQPLTDKILKNEKMIEQIKNWINPSKAYMRCIITTQLEEELAEKLGIPLFANPSRLSSWGTKHGSRDVFQQAKIPLPNGFSEVFTEDDFVSRILDLWNSSPENQTKFVAKLNDGVSGDGNAIFYLEKDKRNIVSEDDKKAYILSQLKGMNFVAKCENWSSFLSKLEKRGAIAEIWLEGNNISSPSAQGLIDGFGKVSILSTHEQILDPKNDSLYLGCHYPAKKPYRTQLAEYCRRIGSILAQKGALERFAVDFVVVPDDSYENFKIYAIEINLRSGGTTHPCETARLICSGKYSSDDGVIIGKDGKQKYYQGSDNIVNEKFKSLNFDVFTKIIEESECKWNRETLTGCVFYFLGALPSCGKVGMLALGNSPEEASSLFESAIETIQKYIANNS